MSKKVSAIIPVINEAAVIGLSVERAWAAGVDEVIVADGGSSDATVAICLEGECKLTLSSPGRGIQLNAGARDATGDLLLFLHADNWLMQSSVAEIKEAANSKGPIFGGFYQRIQNDRSLYRWIESGNAMRVRYRGLVYGDQAMFVSKSIFESIGGFADIPLMEDLDFSQRVKKIVWPQLLNGPTLVDDRRWVAAGPMRQTIRNWYLATAFMMGVAPSRLAKKYRRHDA